METITPKTAANAANAPLPLDVNFNLSRLLRLATFQIGSALGDILVTSIWNRIMINELGLSAGLVGLLIALRYLIAPLSLWAGYWSDTRSWFGLRRTPYIWTGRALVVLSYPLLPLTLSRFAADRGDALGWLIAVACFVMYGTGTLLSGSPFLALVRDSVPKRRQGLAISIVETALIIMFPVAAISLGRAMSHYDLATFWTVTLATMAISAFFWFFAVAGVERPQPALGRDSALHPFNFGATFRKVWQDADTRRFFIFLALATLAAWAQDAILEPFGAQVLKQDVGQTTRYSAYWQTATVIFLIGSVIWLRRRPPEDQSRVTKIGLGVMAIGMAALAVSAFGAQGRVLQIGLVIFGAGFGLYTFGGLSLMTAMTSDAEAGTYLGLWTICILLSRGIGIYAGGLGRDVVLQITGSPAASYGTVFVLEAIGLAAALSILGLVNVPGFARRTSRASADQGIAGSDFSL
jgi:BCD family chlorophyll transporter-like MFS transporter